MRFYVASVRNMSQARMLKTEPRLLTNIGSVTTDYKTVKGLIRYRVTQLPNYYCHVWAIFDDTGKNRKFLGLQYNPADKELCELASRYMKARKYKGDKTSGVSLELRVS